MREIVAKLARQLADRRMIEAVAAIDDLAVCLRHIFAEQIDVRRLAVRGQTRDLAFVLVRLEPTQVRHIRVVVADRIVAVEAVEVLELALSTPHRRASTCRRRRRPA